MDILNMMVKPELNMMVKPEPVAHGANLITDLVKKACITGRFGKKEM